eukprot:CAMPEP_0117038574 /NCGR_PEP_ID=MMETSP0472-20121206/27131_1 /TAXON_ID=693140 ORGANISM="Tiarina fusus, Strain LIS" /NCGR_SAMPLE_ID=MMETSP0472 /ASSEMBLY_ACC=CAM_ASM_000603 /LENGTH=402 /DNA_ID=CAMNT_0004748833 /DNA_START=201 /DNA_END=1409 /DNA_ORIENTATION=+
MVTDAKMQYMFDETGKRYLDLFGGITTISAGHCHPEVVKAAQEQTEKVTHTTTIYLNNQIAEYAEELAAKLPKDLDVIYFTNSGSEANDLAMMMSRLYTGSFDFLALRNAYHGMSYSMMGVTALNTWKQSVPQGFGVHHAMNPNLYRGPFGADDPEAAHKYANDVKDIIQFACPGKVAGFIAEYIQGVGGSVVLPDGYLKEVYEHVHNAGGLCIADEVQTGFGRLGTHFWGFEKNDVKPDIVTMAKSIGNGTPLAALATSRKIAESISGKLHFNTYGGNPVSCAVGRAVLRVIEKDNLQKNCLERGNQLLAGFDKLKEKHDLIGDVRGHGLMLGVEFVKDRKTKEPATQEFLQIFEDCKNHGLLLGKGGIYGNVMRVKPPMCITAEDVEFTLDVLDQAIAKI